MTRHPKFIAPKQAAAYPGRDLDCQMAIEDVFRTAAEYAEASGWSEHEVANALVELAHSHRYALNVRDRMREEIAGVIPDKAHLQ